MRKEAKVGLLVVIASTILYMGFSFLKGKDFLSSSNKYYAQYANVDGLKVSNPILINGFAVGRVDEIEILHEKNDSILVVFSINEDLPVNDKSEAELISTGVLGDKAINLHLNNGTRVLENDSYVTSTVEQSIMASLQKKAMPIVENVDTIVDGFKDYMRGDGEKNINTMVKTVNEILKSTQSAISNIERMVQSNEGNLSETAKNLKLASAELTKTMKSLEPILNNVNGLTDSLSELQLNETVNAAKNSLNKINELMTAINQENGSIGKMIKSPEMHQNLNATIRDIDYLVTDMQANPKRYIQFSVIGGTPKDERAIIKNFDIVGDKIEMNLKRESYQNTVVILFKQDKTSVQIVPQGIGTKNISFNLPADLGKGLFLAKLDWDIDSEAFNFEIK
jgi:phospholipid/cholesterol/gamma-HCH transport system substrate-binding protein